METTLDFQKIFLTYSILADTTLQTQFLHLNRRLVLDEGVDYTLVPKAIQNSYEELLFGGILFDCAPFEAYEIRTTFQIHFTVLQLAREHGFVVLGPYLAEDATIASLEDILVQHQISLAEKANFIAYLQTLPVLTHTKIKAFLNAFILPLEKPEIVTIHAEHSLSKDQSTSCPVFEEDSAQARADMLALRYQRENEFLTSIAQGNYSIGNNMAPVNLNRFPNKLRNEKNQLIILNTLFRKSIEQANVHPYYIDQISAKWAVKIENTATVNQISGFSDEMIADYCKMVKRHSLANYSPTVRNMINFVQFNLSNPLLSLQQIATTMNTSPSYLSRLFNKEVEKSLPEYIKEQRIRLSMRLLTQNENLSIGQIASAVGYADTNYFTKVFRQCTGTTPTSYRANPRIAKNKTDA